MPCGGIYPVVEDSELGQFHRKGSLYNDCFYCNKEIDYKDLMFCDEWDCYLHRDCVIDFLKTEEGKVVLGHGHAVILYLENPNEDSDDKV